MKFHGLVVLAAALSFSMTTQASAQGIFGKLKEKVEELERVVKGPKAPPVNNSSANQIDYHEIVPLRSGDSDIVSGAGCAFYISGREYFVTDYTSAVIRVDNMLRDLNARMESDSFEPIVFNPFDKLPQFMGSISGTGTGLAGFDVKITPLRQFTSSSEEESSAPANIQIQFKEFINMNSDDDRTRIYQTLERNGILKCYA